MLVSGLRTSSQEIVVRWVGGGEGEVNGNWGGWMGGGFAIPLRVRSLASRGGFKEEIRNFQVWDFFFCLFVVCWNRCKSVEWLKEQYHIRACVAIQLGRVAWMVRTVTSAWLCGCSLGMQYLNVRPTLLFQKATPVRCLGCFASRSRPSVLFFLFQVRYPFNSSEWTGFFLFWLISCHLNSSAEKKKATLLMESFCLEKCGPGVGRSEHSWNTSSNLRDTSVYV